MSSIKTIQLFCLALAVGTCLTLALGLLTADGSAAPPAVQNMRGVWDGFDVGAGQPPDPIRTEITGQQNRRFTGFSEPPEPVQPFAIEGTVSASGNVNYQGRSSAGRMSGKAKLLEFGGGASILDGGETRHVNGQTFIVPCVLVMRAFANEPPDPGTPNPEGRYVGTLDGGGVTGQIDMRLGSPPDPIRPQSFNGTIEVVIGGETHAFLLRGTINGSGRIIAIAATTEGHMIFDAILADPPDPGQPATLNGGFTLELHDGTEFDGSFATDEVPVSVS